MTDVIAVEAIPGEMKLEQTLEEDNLLYRIHSHTNYTASYQGKFRRRASLEMIRGSLDIHRLVKGEGNRRRRNRIPLRKMEELHLQSIIHYL